MKKELIDQSIHVLLALVWFFLFVHPLTWWEAIFFVLVFALLRELDQKQWQWSRVGRKDMAFFAIGAVIAALLF